MAAFLRAQYNAHFLENLVGVKKASSSQHRDLSNIKIMKSLKKIHTKYYVEEIANFVDYIFRLQLKHTFYSCR